MLLTLIFPPLVLAPDLQAIATALRSGDFSTASAMTKQGLEKSPNDPKLWTLQSVALSGLHNESAAIASFQHAQKLSARYLPAV
jgi:Flp pilus assembly protein TadD